MGNKNKLRISAWLIITIVVVVVCGLSIWLFTWLRLNRDEYDWGESLRSGEYISDEMAVVEFFGENVYVKITDKNSGDCDGRELLNYLPQSKVFALYSSDGRLLNTRVIGEDLNNEYFNVVLYRQDSGMLSFSCYLYGNKLVLSLGEKEVFFERGGK